MRIAIYPHDLGIGGSQLNAVEIASEIQKRGHEVLILGRPGALVERIVQLGLEFVELPAPSKRPSRRVAMAIRDLIRSRGLDIVHGFEWPPTLEAIWACWGLSAIPCSTVMSMAVAPFIPAWVPLLVGTEQILDVERKRGRKMVELLEPPVDLATNDPNLDFDVARWRQQWSADPNSVVLGIVSRLAHEMKLEGILTAIELVGRPENDAMRLVIAGDGPARARIESSVRSLPSSVRHRITLVGEMSDPRPVYAASDVSLGMGGSALRAMAFSKPLIVQGESGFWRTLDQHSLPDFLWTGWYGVGDGAVDGLVALETEARPLVDNSTLRAQLGAFGRRLVEERFSIDVAADHQIALYHHAGAAPPSKLSLVAGTATGAVRYATYYARKRWRRMRGNANADDFNAQPVAATMRGNFGRSVP